MRVRAWLARDRHDWHRLEVRKAEWRAQAELVVEVGGGAAGGEGGRKRRRGEAGAGGGKKRKGGAAVPRRLTV